MSIERNNELMEAVHNKLPANLSMQLYIDEARWNSEIDRLTAELAMQKSLVAAREQDLNELHIALSQLREYTLKNENIIRDLRERTRWIPVSERLPKRDGFYLVLENVNQVAGYYHWCKQFGWNTDGGRINIQSVTHWMPLPEPPEGDE